MHKFSSISPSRENGHSLSELIHPSTPRGVTELVSEIPPSPSYKSILMAEGTRLSQLQESFTSLKKTSESQFKSLEIEMLALKRQLSLLTVELQKKHQEEVKSSHAPKGQQDLQLVQMGEVQTRLVRLDFPMFTGDDPTGWLYKVHQFFKFQNTLPQHKLRLGSFHM